MKKENLKREKILDAAMRCLARYGVIRATMDDIANELGMKKASLYYYYKNKEAIFIDALEREIVVMHHTITGKFKQDQLVSEKLKLFIKGIIGYFKKKSELFELNISAMIDNHELIKNLDDRLKCKNSDFLARLLREGMDKGEFFNGDAEKIADFLRTMLNARRMEVFRSLSSTRMGENEFKVLENDSLFLLDLILNGLKTRN